MKYSHITTCAFQHQGIQLRDSIIITIINSFMKKGTARLVHGQDIGNVSIRLWFAINARVKKGKTCERSVVSECLGKTIGPFWSKLISVEPKASENPFSRRAAANVCAPSGPIELLVRQSKERVRLSRRASAKTWTPSDPSCSRERAKPSSVELVRRKLANATTPSCPVKLSLSPRWASDLLLCRVQRSML